MSYFPKLFLVILVMLYTLIINMGYIFVISPAYSYLGYTFSMPPIEQIVVATILVALVAIFSPIHVRVPSDFIFWFLFTILYIPSMYIPLYSTYSIQGGELSILPIYITITLCMLMLIWLKYIPLRDLNVVRISYKSFLTGIFLVFFILLIIIIKQFGFHLRFVNLEAVYDLRYAYRDSKDVLSTYAVTWLTKCIGPTFIVLGLLQKKYYFIVVGLFSQLMVFSISGHKSVLFSTALLFLMYICLRKCGNYFGMKFVAMLVSGLLLCFIIDMMNDTDTLISLFLRRFIVTPGLLLGMYYEFFSYNPKALYSYSLFDNIFENPYPSTPAFTIGLNYFGNEEVSANANLWADGFANFGLPGILFVSLLLIIIAYICNCFILKFKNVSLICLVLTMSIWSLTDTSLFTTLITHGLLLNLFILCFLPNNRQKE